ncbi:DNA segregation ATPase FtsK/SpoIIIE, S-DNA-T family [Lachnospiraceae bacterium RM5]|nr:DNA segregation ATPase FtsK/SpoIIIE, S-DNA-T family [Lachnospiraceae bacterium RM5]
MPAKTKKTSNKKNTGKKTQSKKKIEDTTQKSLVSGDVKLIIGFVIMLLLELSTFSLLGVFGKFLSGLIFGIYGIFSYVMPFAIFVFVCFCIANRKNKKVLKKSGYIYFLFFSIRMFVQFIAAGDGYGLDIKNIYKFCSKEKSGGGIMPGIIDALFYSTIGVYGTCIVIISMILIGIVLVTEKSIVKDLTGKSKDVYVRAKDGYNTQRERNKERSRERRNNIKKVQPVNTYNIGGQISELDAKVYKGHVDIEDSEDNEEPFYDEYSGDSGINDNIREDSKNKRIIKKKAQVKKEIFNTPPAEEYDENYDETYDDSLDENLNDGLNNRINDKFNESVNETTDKTISNEAGNKPKKGMVPKYRVKGDYQMPPLSLLKKGVSRRYNAGRRGISETAIKLQETLDAFGVKASVINENRGPSVTRYELQPETGTKVSRITSLADDIKLNLAASDIRIEAPIPGKAAVGIEVPNSERDPVFLRDLIESDELKKNKSKISFAAGMDITGNVIVADIAKMPHMLIAGTTGSGKSVFTNSIIMSILYRAKPSEVRLLIIDPKVVEFGVYNGIPHLLAPVVTDPRKAAGTLNWAVGEMTRRYQQFAKYKVKEIKSYNEKIKSMNYVDGEEKLEHMPQIVIIIDELADLMMAASKEVESAICRLAQLARAAGIHLVIATQRPSVDVVTGLIKANIPSRVALLVSSGTDSRTIIDTNGGEKLLGNGDMLFYPAWFVKPVRLQGAFVSDVEVQSVVEYIKTHNVEVEYDKNVENVAEVSDTSIQSNASSDDKDILFEQAARFVIEKEKASTSMIQRMFKIGFNRASRIIDQLEEAGIVGSDVGTKPRKVLMTMPEFEEYISKNDAK